MKYLKLFENDTNETTIDMIYLWYNINELGFSNEWREEYVKQIILNKKVKYHTYILTTALAHFDSKDHTEIVTDVKFDYDEGYIIFNDNRVDVTDYPKITIYDYTEPQLQKELDKAIREKQFDL